MIIMGISEKQKRFADYYIETGNAEESAKRAGYSARGNTSKLLHNTTIRQYMDEKIAKKDIERIAKQDEVLQYYSAVMRAELKEPVLVLDGDGTQRIEYLPPSIATRNKAAEQLGKRYALWTDKQQINNAMPVVIVNDLED